MICQEQARPESSGFQGRRVERRAQHSACKTGERPCTAGCIFWTAGLKAKVGLYNNEAIFLLDISGFRLCLKSPWSLHICPTPCRCFSDAQDPILCCVLLLSACRLLRASLSCDWLALHDLFLVLGGLGARPWSLGRSRGSFGKTSLPSRFRPISVDFGRFRCSCWTKHTWGECHQHFRCTPGVASGRPRPFRAENFAKSSATAS